MHFNPYMVDVWAPDVTVKLGDFRRIDKKKFWSEFTSTNRILFPAYFQANYLAPNGTKTLLFLT